MAVTPKPPAYTVNTGHAKCPDHLYMCDEGSGSTLTDKGKAGALVNLAFTNTNGNLTWQVDGTHGNVLRFGDSNTTDFAGVTNSMGMTAGTGAALALMIGRWNSATLPSANTALTSFGLATQNGHATMILTTAGRLRDARGDTVSTDIANDNGTTVVADNTVRFLGHKFVDNSGGTSIDGAAWDLDTGTQNWGTTENFAIGARCLDVKLNFLVPNASITYDVIAVMVWINDYATWTNTWISDLYADPWQFVTAVSGVPSKRTLLGVG